MIVDIRITESTATQAVADFDFTGRALSPVHPRPEITPILHPSKAVVLI
jgi:hypothetical protein